MHIVTMIRYGKYMTKVPVMSACAVYSSTALRIWCKRKFSAFKNPCLPPILNTIIVIQVQFVVYWCWWNFCCWNPIGCGRKVHCFVWKNRNGKQYNISTVLNWNVTMGKYWVLSIPLVSLMVTKYWESVSEITNVFLERDRNASHQALAIPVPKCLVKKSWYSLPLNKT